MSRLRAQPAPGEEKRGASYPAAAGHELPDISRPKDKYDHCQGRHQAELCPQDLGQAADFVTALHNHERWLSFQDAIHNSGIQTRIHDRRKIIDLNQERKLKPASVRIAFYHRRPVFVAWRGGAATGRF
jgi:hypothetical protein